MEDHTEVIRQQMADTRDSLSDKLEALENKVINTVQDTTESVTNKVESIADAVQGTAENVQNAVHRTVESVQHTVHDTVETVKDSLNVTEHVRRHPWAMLVGSFAAGFLAERLLSPARHTMRDLTHAGFHPADRPWSQAIQPAPAPAHHAADQGKSEGFLDHMTERLQPAIDQLKDLAIGATTNLIGEMILSSVGPSMQGEVKSVLDKFATALGGKPVKLSEGFGSSGTTSSSPSAAPSPPRAEPQPHNRLSALKGNGRSG